MALLDLVHTDVEDPLNIRSLSGARRFVPFIDDASRWVLVFNMSHKSETLGKLVLFQRLAETHTGCTICVLRSDNGSEYASHFFRDNLYQHGIHHELTVPHTRKKMAWQSGSTGPSWIWFAACFTIILLRRAFGQKLLPPQCILGIG